MSAYRIKLEALKFVGCVVAASILCTVACGPAAIVHFCCSCKPVSAHARTYWQAGPTSNRSVNEHQPTVAVFDLRAQTIHSAPSFLKSRMYGHLKSAVKHRSLSAWTTCASCRCVRAVRKCSNLSLLLWCSLCICEQAACTTPLTSACMASYSCATPEPESAALMWHCDIVVDDRE